MALAADATAAGGAGCDGEQESSATSSESSSDDSDDGEAEFIPSKILGRGVRDGVTYYRIEWQDNTTSCRNGVDVEGDAAFRTVLQEFNRQAHSSRPILGAGDRPAGEAEAQGRPPQVSLLPFGGAIRSCSVPY